jgi:hypothetical protein
MKPGPKAAQGDIAGIAFDTLHRGQIPIHE